MDNARIERMRQERIRIEKEISDKQFKLKELDQKIEKMEFQSIKNILNEKNISLEEAINLLRSTDANE